MVAGLAGLVMLAAGLNHMLNIGSCSSGGPYVSTRTCPSGTIWWTLLLLGGILLWVAGIVVSRHGLAQPGIGQLLWSLGFAGLGLLVLIKAAVQDSMAADIRSGAYIMSGVFIPMGLAFGVGALLRRRRTPGTGTPRAHLRRLRDTGVLTPAEYDRLRAAIAEPGTADRLAVLQRLTDDNASGLLTEREYADRKSAALA